MQHDPTSTTLAEEAAHTAKAKADKAAAEASETIAQAADPYADAARNAAEEFQTSSAQAQGLNAVADHIDDLTQSLRSMNAGDIATHMQQAAQRNPLLFLGGAALAGFAAARMLKASNAPGRNPWALEPSSAAVKKDAASYADKVARNVEPTALGGAS